MSRITRTLTVAVLLVVTEALAFGQPRARDLGVPFVGTPGALNAITDIDGVEVGQVTLVEGEGPLEVGKGPVRTGVTIVLPRGRSSKDPVFAGWFTLNGNGEMTGTTWIESPAFSKDRSPLRIPIASASCATRSSAGKRRTTHSFSRGRFPWSPRPTTAT